MQKSVKRAVTKIQTDLWLACVMCGDRLKGVGYEYQAQQFVPDYVPPKLITCRKCVYRQCFGSKTYKKKMKEGVLDD